MGDVTLKCRCGLIVGFSHSVARAAFGRIPRGVSQGLLGSCERCRPDVEEHEFTWVAPPAKEPAA